MKHLHIDKCRVDSTFFFFVCCLCGGGRGTIVALPSLNIVCFCLRLRWPYGQMAPKTSILMSTLVPVAFPKPTCQHSKVSGVTPTLQWHPKSPKWRQNKMKNKYTHPHFSVPENNMLQGSLPKSTRHCQKHMCANNTPHINHPPLNAIPARHKGHQ